jgi:hypothetical protein
MERMTGIVATNHPVPEPERILFGNGARLLSHAIQTCREPDMRAWVEDTLLPVLIRDSWLNKLGEAVALRIERVDDGCSALVAEMQLAKPCSGQFAVASRSRRPWGKGNTVLQAIVVDELIDPAPHVLSRPASGSSNSP